MDSSSLEDAEVKNFLESIFNQYGYDFREYSPASMLRRIGNAQSVLGFKSIAELQEHVLKDPEIFNKFLTQLTVNVTEMFRDPHVFARIRELVIPVLRTYPSIRIWHAGCSTGEEVYSMAILLKEAGLYEKSFLYATDINSSVLDKAKAAIYPAEQIQLSTANYQKAGGVESFANYYTVKNDYLTIDESLKKNILFSPHNLAVDQVFSEVHVVFCRNVLIYFSKALQDRVLSLCHESLIHHGFLILGTKETTEFTSIDGGFEKIDRQMRIYRKL
ncbi:MAG: CheR family methyltransferase [Pseudobdellovibrio sp.]